MVPSLTKFHRSGKVLGLPFCGLCVCVNRDKMAEFNRSAN